MSRFDLEKRDALLRKYCPEMFEEETTQELDPDEDNRLQLPGGKIIDAITYKRDSNKELSQVFYVSGDVNNAIFGVFQLDQPEVCRELEKLIQNPEITSTAIVDEQKVHDAIGYSQSVAMTMMDNPSKYVGMSEQDVIDEFVRIFGEAKDGAERVETISLEEFVEGNHELDGIAPNLSASRRPTREQFLEVFQNIQAMPDVIDVRLSVHEWPYPDEDDWVSVESIYIWASKGIDLKEVGRIIVPLHMEGVDMCDREVISQGAPEPSDRIVVLWSTWD